MKNLNSKFLKIEKPDFFESGLYFVSSFVTILYRADVSGYRQRFLFL
jgi:hypothetical protein